MKKLLLMFVTAIVLLAGFSVVLTARYVSTQAPVTPAPEIAVPAGAAERLAGAIRIPTISAEDAGSFDGDTFRAFRDYLESAFPLVHSRLRREVVGTHSLLYTWTGSDPSADPILLTGHMDVVPIEPGTENKWGQDPFSGKIVDGFIWGRGAIDNKSAVVGTLEAVDMLLAEGFRPSRTVMLAYGHDEEIGGVCGAGCRCRALFGGRRNGRRGTMPI